MLIFANSASPSEICDLLSITSLDGVTMNPSLVAAAGSLDLSVIIQQFLELIKGPIFVQVTGTNAEEMVAEGQRLGQISHHVVVKLPCTSPGFVACRHLTQLQVPVNMTLCFTPAQALLAARAGAKWVSPFVGRLDDAGRHGAAALKAMCSALRDYASSTSVLAASIRSDEHFTAALEARVRGVTLSPSQILEMHDDPLTEEGCAAFARDWAAAASALNNPVREHPAKLKRPKITSNETDNDFEPGA
jgi:transaldolase